MPEVAPYGSWKSPISADVVLAGAVRLSQVRLDGADVYWIEERSAEGGRHVLVRRTPGGQIADVTPQGFNARSRVHEYGGGAYTVSRGSVYFSNFSDQRLYRQADPTAEPQSLTPDGNICYADAIADEARGRLICVREDRRSSERDADNSIVAVPLAGGEPQVLASGSDFYSSPALSPDGTRLAWLAWDHPNMPWDGTELWVAELDAEGRPANPRLVAGARDESIFQPSWSPEGVLYFVSDRSGWWNLYRERDGRVEAVLPMEAEFGEAQWLFGMSTYAFLDERTILAIATARGETRLLRIDLSTSSAQPIETPYEDFGYIRAGRGGAAFLAGGPDRPAAIVIMDPASGKTVELRRSREITVGRAYFSLPQHIEFSTAEGQRAYAFYYPPANPDFVAPEGERPPLLVKSHGGPTSSTTAVLNLQNQYWTSRGFAVLDVDYRGSTGYGRDYRRMLNGQWGIVDVDDCVNGALHLVQQGLADPARLAITGGSAGGYTTLCVLTFRDSFAAGASHFGVSDLEALELDTHKFESRYLEGLIGPYPERRDLFLERSPIYHTDQLNTPVAFFQGLEDKIVPPDQAEKMVDAIRAKGLPVTYVAFEGEQHGFRKAENIRRALEGEFYFYSVVFGFQPADRLEPLTIENL